MVKMWPKDKKKTRKPLCHNGLRVLKILRGKQKYPLKIWDCIPVTIFPFIVIIETVCKLTDCILKLPKQQRTVILLKYQHGYSLREIAKLLDISLAWAQKIDQRAKKKLEELYQQGGGSL